jgi:hypothetical protein
MLNNAMDAGEVLLMLALTFPQPLTPLFQVVTMLEFIQVKVNGVIL